MTDAPQAYPLAWPHGRPRRMSWQRKDGRFASGSGSDRSRISIDSAARRVEAEVERLGGSYPVVSSNVQLTLSGRVKADHAKDDPGVAVYFQLKSKPYVLACDLYTRVADNLAAIAAHIEATRAITRHGVASAEETLQAFQALPAPARWFEVLDLRQDASIDEITSAFRAKALKAHPDKPGGSHDQMARLSSARDEGLKARGA